MTIRIALNHQTHYRYERPASVGPQVVRLRPAPHCRTPILSYSLKIQPADHFINWQQDPHGNFQARIVFPEKVRELKIDVDLIADMSVINPFDFFVEPSANDFPFKYEHLLAKDLLPFLECEAPGPRLSEFLKKVDCEKRYIAYFLVDLNQLLQKEIEYAIRMEPGVQTPEETLTLKKGSCRDSAWLLVQILRQFGLATRFCSGYLVQLVPDIKALDGPSGSELDFTDLHAWTEVFIPGAGWIGLDPTSGLMAGEGHIPVACTPDPSTAAPVSGGVEAVETEFDFSMSIKRIHEDPRVTKPYSEEQWQQIDTVGKQVDERLTRGDVRLTMGGEPTFVSIDDMEGAEWNTAAVGPTKRRLAAELLLRLQQRFAPNSLLHFGQGKWYPGEPLPRWAFSCYWRNDTKPVWLESAHVAKEGKDYGHTNKEAKRFVEELAKQLEVDKKCAMPAYEDAWHYIDKERKLAVNVDPSDSKLKNVEERVRLARLVEQGLGEVSGYVLPLKRQWWQAKARWTSSPWPMRSGVIFLLPGDSPIGLRLPMESLPWTAPTSYGDFFPTDPTAPREELPEHPGRRAMPEHSRSETGVNESAATHPPTSPQTIVRTALCIEPREGRLHVFMPPTERLEDYLDLLTAVETTSAATNLPVVLEGYTPPHDHRISHISVTPDPGVIEVNVHPAGSWDELTATTTILYEEARLTRLGTEKFDLDGRHTGTGGGNHIVMGGKTPLDSPFLRRPDLLKSLITYWNNHPSLSYLFSGGFIGPTSQAPRVDEGRRDAIYELEIACAQIPDPSPDGNDVSPWVVDRTFRNLLVDLTGNTHRAEFCIDKLYSPDSSTGRLGLVEFRGFEMPPHARMSLTQQLLLRALVARFWEQPYKEKLVHWGTTLHDRFLLPHFVRSDLRDVIAETREFGIPLELDWFASHFEFRFQAIGTIQKDDVKVELRQAIEPWYVLGEEPGGGGTARYVDSSVERLQVKVNGMTDSRHMVTCNGRKLPLQSTGVQGEYVAGVRYRAWQPPSCLHPTIPVHTPLVVDLVDIWNRRSIGGCTYHVSHPGGRHYDTFPVNSYEAESRRASRFFASGHTGGPIKIPADELNPQYPLTLDLRRASPNL
ncbi:MAG: transglutaminase family protein [Planctomycetaceae bacterium]|nr:transglutaminase family protein [Planctomycetales bacterium]MCB9937194.1 transglutaminase family protein [Planctomycetaceae bacterium]